jgi:hypothetical protein
MMCLSLRSKVNQPLQPQSLFPTQERLVFEASQLKGCTITTFPDQNKILPLLGFLPTAADPPDEVWSQVFKP